MKADGGKVLLMRLYEKTSASGNRYFAGRMGAAKVAMFLDKRAEGTDPVWEVFVQSGDDGHGLSQGKAATTPQEPLRKRPRNLPDPVKAAIGWAVPDDPLPGG